MKKLRTLFFTCILLISTSILKGEGVVYVVPDGFGTGASWIDGIGDIQAAIDLAAESSKDVWIQSGTYLVNSTIILKSGVNIYGGFSGIETTLSERPKISGGGPWDYLLPTTLDGGGKCRIMQSTSVIVTETIVDGITFINGNGVSSNEYIPNQGGAIFIAKNVIYQNCIVRNNYALEYGGGISMTGGTVRQCLIESNTQDQANTAYGRGGGGLYVNTATDNTSTIENCVIQSNKSNRGAGIRGQGNGMLYLKNTKIYNNSCNDLGAAADFGSVGIEMSNCLIFNNRSEKDNVMVITGGNIYNNTIVNNIGIVYLSNASNTYQFVNNIVWGNKTKGGATTVISGGKNNTNLHFYNNVTGVVLDDLDLVWGWTHADNQYVSAAVANAPHFRGNVLFTGVAENEDQKYELDAIDLSILQTSPCFNTGKTIAAVTNDIVGVSRPQGDAYDVGAYEFDLGTSVSILNDNSNNAFKWYVQGNGIKIIINTDETMVTVYSISGIQVFSGNVTDTEIYVPLNQGIYVVRIGDVVKKVIL